MANSHPIPNVAHFKDITGLTFGRWRVISYAGKGNWNCRCECGAERVVWGTNLRRPKGASTGCLECANKRMSSCGCGLPAIPLVDRFQKYCSEIQPSGCILWTGHLSTSGYGQLKEGKHDGKQLDAHRVAWELFRGPIPDGLWVLHKCDVRNCVNTDHLFLGTVLDNGRDMAIKGRAARGERSRMAKLTDQSVREIQLAMSSGKMFQFQVAEQYGVSEGAVGDIVRKKTWKHVV